ncbi:histone-lysine N-methyltransferase [Trichophyton tonsurans CBS 112818]|uniref:Histone-lysine N-methyltransferase, H3 lysine-36 specific n=1 Tax=Trichophyton tonsurans (strain CBS 112818) TaxID=647933 RepID=F2RN17_TRIT1|nr:histone-lysine N-methyltransferase [Trichophyton tonsurans CBS 112818]
MAHHDDVDVKTESVADAVTDMKLEREDSEEGVSLNGKTSSNGEANGTPATPAKSAASSPPDRPSSALMDEESEEKVGGDITVKQEPGQPPKLARSATKKVVPRKPQMFDHLPDSTAEATSLFQVIDACTYSNKNMGYTDHAMECDCAEEWNPKTGINEACGEDSDCINRATKMECVDNCGCGDNCQNQRFQKRQYADVTVIKTEKKGFGLRANTDLRPNDFIFEYIGEVINEPQFRKRMIQYDDEGIKHFYFMSLNKGEFVDATRKGNLGRFCNHSCNPNCYIDKWVVGEKLRMGIFAEKYIKAGEELVFNYNVDRYGADPQPCYCGEANCLGYIGGKTQTERATKLSNATIEALGIDDLDSWDTALPKRPKKKKTAEDDEEYVDRFQPKSLDEEGVTKVMATLMQCKEKWIAVKLLGRMQRCDDERVINRIVRMHGYQILNSQLSAWKEDFNVVLQILQILDKFPRLTRNKIIDSKIETTVKPLTECGEERVEKQAASLLETWSALEVGYRIPRMKRDPALTANIPSAKQFERREVMREREDRPRKSASESRDKSPKSPSVDPTRVAPRGPAAHGRGGKSHRNSYHQGPRPFRRPFNPLPSGWFAAEANGKTYYYSARGDTTWVRPTAPAPQPPPPPKPESKDKTLQDIIDGIMNSKEDTPKSKDKEVSATPATPADVPQKKEHKPKWKSLSEEKQKKIYENTLFPHVKYVVDKFKNKLPKDDLKRYAKEVAKKLVNSDFKNNRVTDPTKVSEKQIKQVKKFCKEYFEKAVVKHQAYEKKKAEHKRKHSKPSDSGSKEQAIPPPTEKPDESDADDDDVNLSDNDEPIQDDVQCSSPREDESMTPGGSLKRKRDIDESVEENDDTKLDGSSLSKRQRSESPPVPPPPPPPMSPDNSMEVDDIDGGFKRKMDEEYELEDENTPCSRSPGKYNSHGSSPPPFPPPPPLPADMPDRSIDSYRNEQSNMDDETP